MRSRTRHGMRRRDARARSRLRRSTRHPAASNASTVGLRRPRHTTIAKPVGETGRSVPRQRSVSTSGPTRMTASWMARRWRPPIEPAISMVIDPEFTVERSSIRGSSLAEPAEPIETQVPPSRRNACATTELPRRLPRVASRTAATSPSRSTARTLWRCRRLGARSSTTPCSMARMHAASRSSHIRSSVRAPPSDVPRLPSSALWSRPTTC